MDISPALRDDLLTYLLCSSPDRARIIAELLVRNPGTGELLANLEGDEELRARCDRALVQVVVSTSHAESSQAMMLGLPGAFPDIVAVALDVL
jgi:hypothetical protein